VTTTKKDGYRTPMGHEGDFYPELRVRNVSVRLDRVLLRDGNMNVDLALMPGQLSGGNGVMLLSGEQEVAGPGDFGKRGRFDTQVNDPRCNLGRDQWTVQTVSGDNWYGNIGYRNDVLNYNANEPETFDPGEDPVNNRLSTAYIPHKPMESLWELGAIHRGLPWQTINLKCADDKNSSSMNDYKYGDGHLLDQVSLVETNERNKTVVGMINLNCVAGFDGGGSPFVFKSLFTDFPIYETYRNMRDNSGASGAQRTLTGDAVNSSNSGSNSADAYAQDLADSVTYAIHSQWQPRRTAIFPNSNNGSRTHMLIPITGTDAEREEVICRIINILKWSRQQTRKATVLALAQTIQDVGGATLERYFSEKTTDNEAIMMDSGFKPYDGNGQSTRWIQPPLLNSASKIRNAYKSRPVGYRKYDNFYDRITGEAKVLVRLEWDDSAYDGKGAWKVTRKEYAE